jgi:hypothetical protein
LIDAVMIDVRESSNPEGRIMAKRLHREDYPLWVKFSIWGVPGRVGMWCFFYFSIACAVGCIAYGFVNPFFFGGVAFFFSALMYWLAIRWIDRYGLWKPEAEPEGLAYDEYES